MGSLVMWQGLPHWRGGRSRSDRADCVERKHVVRVTLLSFQQHCDPWEFALHRSRGVSSPSPTNKKPTPVWSQALCGELVCDQLV